VLNQPAVKHKPRGNLHGVTDFHLHLLFGRPVSVADDGDDATQLHPDEHRVTLEGAGLQGD